MNFAVVRERYVEELMAREAVAGLDQIVILGAGFDTRSYRLPGLGNIPVYEVDHPVTQAAKRKALNGVVEPPASRILSRGHCAHQAAEAAAREVLGPIRN